MEKYKYWNSKRNLFWAISRQDPKWELPEGRLESLHSGDFQRGFASERGLSLQKKLLWHANVTLRSFEVCPSLLKNASHTTDKCKHPRSCSRSLLNSDLHLQENQAENHELGNAVHLQRGITVPGLWAESCHCSRSQVPTSTAPRSCPHHTQSLGLEPFPRSI